MTTFTAGSRVRFNAMFQTAGKSADPKRVTALVNGEEVATNQGQVGEVWFQVVVVEGPLTIVFEASTGERSETQFEVVPAVAVEEPLVLSAAELIADQSATQEPPTVHSPEPPEPHFDRAHARSRLMAAGFWVDDWSDAKMRGALQGLDDTERQRRVHRR